MICGKWWNNRWLWGISLMLLQLMVAWAVPTTETKEMMNRMFAPDNLAQVERLYGKAGRTRIEQWQQLIKAGGNWTEQEKLRRVNDFFNRVRFLSDQEHWGQRDYWATPIEFLGTNGGDCEDFSIAKFFTLSFLGVSELKLRLIYAKALELNQAHMVLGYYATPGAVPLILDNINKQILPASQRRDLAPVYSFNGQGLWQAKAFGRGRKISSDISDIDLVTDLMWRIERGEMQTAAGR